MVNLGLDYVDLYLIHWPCAGRGLFAETYNAMETLYREGKVRAIGVSNFQPGHLDELMQKAEVVPAVNQIELHPWLQQAGCGKCTSSSGSAPRPGAPWAVGRSWPTP